MSNLHFRRALSLFLLVALAFLSACEAEDVQTASGGGGPVESIEPVEQPVMTQSTPLPLVVRKGSTVRSTPEQPSFAVPPTQPQFQPTKTPETEAPAPPFQICSPLVDTPISELPSIIADPYRPPPAGSEARHHGVDFAYFRKFNRAAIEGAGLQAVMKGVVAAAIVDSYPYGNMLIIETSGAALPAELASRIQIAAGESLYVLFAHMERPPSARLGDAVEACQALGTVGKSGNAGGSHLHMETRLGASGGRFQKMGYYKIWGTEEERANYLLWRISGEYRHFDPMVLFPK